MISVHSSLEGFYKFEAVKLDAEGNELSRRVLADWFPNVITDAGLNYIGKSESYNFDHYCHVGSGTTAPSVLDGSLVLKVATKTSPDASPISAQTAPPYYIKTTNRYRFAVGAAAGNLSEVGIGWAVTGIGLFSRALILDGLGNPTTITVLFDEVLDVFYEIRTYPPTVDTTGSIIIGPVTHTYVMRAQQVTSPSPYGGWYGLAPYGWMGIFNVYWINSVYTGDIGLITGSPSGTGASSSSSQTAVNAAYANNSLERFSTITYGLVDGNLTGGIKSASVVFQTGSYQIQFTPNIDKTSAKVMTLTYKQSWGRRVL